MGDDGACHRRRRATAPIALVSDDDGNVQNRIAGCDHTDGHFRTAMGKIGC